MKVDFKKLTYICGFLGSAIMILGSLITAILYEGRKGEPYSILNHYISKLGEVGVSRLAPVFNGSLIVGGLVLIIFVIGLGLHIHTKLGCVASAFGTFSCVSCSLVGVFPMNNLSIHKLVTFSFFYSGLVAITLFNLVIIFDKEKKISKWLLIPGIVTVASFASFLIIPYMIRSTLGHTLHPNRLVRFHIRLNPILEWSVFLTVITWFVLASVYLMAKRRTKVAEMVAGRSSKARRYDSERVERMEG
jgi:hypothetical membrane protein